MSNARVAALALDFELARREFSRLAHGRGRVGRDLRWARALADRAESRLDAFDGAAREQRAAFVQLMRDECREIEAATFATAESRRVGAESWLVRVRVCRAHVLRPQRLVTRSLARIDALGTLLTDAAEQARRDAATELAATSRSLARELDRQRAACIASRARLDQREFADALVAEAERAAGSAEAAHDAGDADAVRFALDRGADAFRQILDVAPPELVSRVGELVAGAARAWGPGAEVARAHRARRQTGE
ncbi:MAG: hypothetical protein H6698_09780 [Myxococcales bacterium]|nr:hypothetical protein [Myxococcales bacterium]MCB9534572.1 hypothetical protein [Myxococcales bacterium]